MYAASKHAGRHAPQKRLLILPTVPFPMLFELQVPMHDDIIWEVCDDTVVVRY